MTISEQEYFAARSALSADLTRITDLETRYVKLFLYDILIETADALNEDFTRSAHELLPFWINYPPEQRGRQPTGESLPLLELGEKTISAHLIAALHKHVPHLSFPGLPTGADIRFATSDALIHLDIKLTGPNDNPNEIVVPPNQISGDGVAWNGGVSNSPWPVHYMRSGKVNYWFQPKLPPFYVLGGEILVCLTIFLKVIYGVEEFGIQPLKHFEIACVPNGLLLFDGPTYANTEGLIISGKDARHVPDENKRIRIRLNPLASIDRWRAIQLALTEYGWKHSLRAE